MTVLQPQQPAPYAYYQNNCRTLLTFVQEQYADILSWQGLGDQINAYLRASQDAQRLFARILTRKGPVIRIDKLDYAEVKQPTAALHELVSAGLVEHNPVCAADLLLHKLTKPELQQWLSLGAQGKRLKKAQYILACIHRWPENLIRARVQTEVQWIQIREPYLWWVLRLLYFGERVQDWSAFVLRDLGQTRYEPVALHNQMLAQPARFLAELNVRRLSALSYRLAEFPLAQSEFIPELVRALVQLKSGCGEVDGSAVSERMLRRRADKALLRIAAHAEKEGHMEFALNTYQHTQRHPARERIARIYAKLGQEDLLEQHLSAMQANPWCGEEVQFVQRFGKRNAGFKPQTDEVEVTQLHPNVEQQVLEILTQKGGWGAHVENSLVRTLTGLLYWPIIFANLPGAYTNPFQSAPNDLYHEDFVNARADLIEAHEASLADDQALVDFMLTIATEKHLIANHLVNWTLLEHIPLSNLVQAIPANHIRSLCGYLIRHLNTRRSGLPDLLVVYGPHNYELVEVKGPTDQLQPGQRVWLKALQRMHIPNRVVKVKVVS